MRVVLIASAPPAVLRVSELLTGMGHDLPAVIAIRAPAGRYGPEYPRALHRVLPSADLLFVCSGEHLCEFLRAYAPDVALCASFPALIPEDALGVPRYGIVNGHPGLLPRYRGPNPLGWALRNGDEEIGTTLHRMTTELDAGPILAQATFRVGSDEDPTTALQTNTMWGPLIQKALERAEAGDLGDDQDESQATYAARFEPEYIEVDWTKTAREIHNQTRAWTLAPPVDGVRGALTTLDGQRVRLLRTHLDDSRGGVRMTCGDGPLWILKTEPVAE